MVFSFFKKKPVEKNITPIEFRRAFEEVYSFLSENYKEDLERAREDFIHMTGQFDEEHEYFQNKLDDFRNWFLFYFESNEQLFKYIHKLEGALFEKYHSHFACSVHAVFEVKKVKEDNITLYNLFNKETYMVCDQLKALSLEQGDFMQTSLFETANDNYEFGVSAVFHPSDAKKYILKKVKDLKKRSRKEKVDLKVLEVELLKKLISMRYQLFKYKQVSIKQIYSDKELFKNRLGN